MRPMLRKSESKSPSALERRGMAPSKRLALLVIPISIAKTKLPDVPLIVNCTFR